MGVVAPTVMRQIDANDLVDAIDVNVIAQELDLDPLVERLDINAIAQRLDLDALVQRLDINAIAQRLDLDALVQRLDINAIAQQLDLDALVDRLDINAIAQRLDLDALVDRLDINAIAQRLDLDALVDRLDINAIAQQLDLDALVDRLDINAIAQQLDLDALVDRLDINAIAERLDLAKITAGATQDVAVTGLDLVRRQLVRADATVDSLVGRVIRRSPGARPEAPGLLVDRLNPPEPDIAEDRELQRRDVSGHYAGPATRLLALVGDVFAAVGLQAALAWVAFFFVGLVFGADTPSGIARWVSVVVLAVAFVGYFWVPVALFGRTLFMAILGLAVVRRDGGIAGSGRALARAVVLPLSILFPFFLLGAVLGRERRTLHDAVSGTIEVYDWGEREAEQPATIRQQLSARVRRHEASPRS